MTTILRTPRSWPAILVPRGARRPARTSTRPSQGRRVRGPAPRAPRARGGRARSRRSRRPGCAAAAGPASRPPRSGGRAAAGSDVERPAERGATSWPTATAPTRRRRPTGRSWSRTRTRCIEGVAIAALAIGADEAIVAVRAEATEAIRALESRPWPAEEAGFVGARRPRLRPRPRDHRPAGPGRLHARRGDGPPEGPRGQARPARAAAAASRRARPLRPRRPSSRTSRPSPPWRGSSPTGPRRSRRSARRQPGHDPRLCPRRRAAPASPRSRSGTPLRDIVALGGKATSGGLKACSSADRPAGSCRRSSPTRAYEFEALRDGRRPHRVGLDRGSRQAGLHRRPGPPADPLLRRRGVRQDDPLPDRPPPRHRDRRPDGDGRPAADDVQLLADPRPTSPGGRCATTSGWRRSRT